MTGLSHSPQRIALQAHAITVSPLHMSELFKADPKRLSWACVDACGFSLDFSKNRMTKETLSLLVDLAKARDLTGWSTRMASGEIINTTEEQGPLAHRVLGWKHTTSFPDLVADMVEADMKRIDSVGKASAD